MGQTAGEREWQLLDTNVKFGRGSSGTAEAQAIIRQNREPQKKAKPKADSLRSKDIISKASQWTGAILM